MLTVKISTDRKTIEKGDGLSILQQTGSQMPENVEWERINWPGVSVICSRCPETSLIWQNHDRNAGICGTAIVQGYTCFANSRIKKNEMARTLLSRWRNRGAEFIKDLEGSFSLFLYDADLGCCLLATDPMGSRPLWYSCNNPGTLIASSDVCEVAMRLHIFPTMDLAAAWSFLHRRTTVGDRSYFSGVRSLASGCAWEFKNGLTSNRSFYTEPVVQPNHKRSLRDTASVLLEALSQTVRNACADSRSPALFLSGGLDSRLIAGISDSRVTAVTLCDQYNSEVRIAEKIAGKCGLKHHAVARSPEWYPRMMDRACWANAGIHCWNESHYYPLNSIEQGFPYDVAMLGFGSDALFKGLYLKWPMLWKGWNGVRGPAPTKNEFVQLALCSSNHFEPWLKPVLKQNFLKTSEEAYREAVGEKYAQISNWASFAPDLWMLFTLDNFHRSKSFANLVSLRTLVSERNLFSSPRIWQLFISIPCYKVVQRPNAIISEALRLIGKKLAWIPDANSWLPVRAPNWAHNSTLSVRRKVAYVRNKLLSARANGTIAGSSGWTRFDRLLRVSKILREKMEMLISDQDAFSEDIFNLKAIQVLWRDHLEGRSDHANQLYQLASFANFRRQIRLL